MYNEKGSEETEKMETVENKNVFSNICEKLFVRLKKWSD